MHSNRVKKQSVEKAYISHLLRYVGVGLISGSIVHVGTLGGGHTLYAVLIALGIISFIVGTLLEKQDSESSLPAFIGISVMLSIGVGMVSGGTQHYLDGPVYAAFLIPIGVAVGYLAFLWRDYKSEITLKRILVMSVVALGLGIILYLIAKEIPAQRNHHSAGNESALEANSPLDEEMREEGEHTHDSGHAH